MAVIERPHRFCFSKNEIRYVFLLADVDARPGLYLQARIMYAGIQDAEFTELYAFDGLKPDADGYVYLYIQAYLDSVLQFVLPHLDAALTDAERSVHVFMLNSEKWKMQIWILNMRT
jgi:hypothetical protein